MPNQKWEVYKNHETGILFDLTDADAQGKLTAILDGTTIDSFADVESALAGKASASDVTAIEGKIPSNASSSNKMATASDVASRVDWSSYAKTGVYNLLGAYYGKSWQYNTGNLIDAGNAISSAKIPVKSGDKLYASKKNALDTNYNMVARTFDTNGDYVGSEDVLLYGALTSTFTVPSGVYYIGVTQFVAVDQGTKATQDANEIMLTYSPNAPYAPYAMTNRELTDAVAVKDGTVTSDFTVGTETMLSKVGKLVTCAIRINDITSATAWTTAICNIPQGYRPKGTSSRMITGYSNGAICLVSVSGYDGNVVPSVAVTNGAVIFAGSWVTD